MTLTRADRLDGGLIGLLVGDALGVPYEFHDARQIPPPEQIEYTPPPHFRRAHAGTPPGTWSDDGAQALCLLASLLDQGRMDVDDFAKRLLQWSSRGYCAVDGRVFDIGNQTSVAMRALARGVPADRAGPKGEWDNGNGSLMRVLPLALWHQGGDDALVHDAHQQSLPTHAHPRALACCALYCLWARRLLEEHPTPWADAVETLRAIYAAQPQLAAELEGHILPHFDHAGSGYVIDALHSARAALAADSYEGVVRAAIGLGQDTDTTAAIAGGIAGVRAGVDDIPIRWRDALRGDQILAPLRAGLLAR